MIKTFLILVLGAALLVAGVVTRPSERSAAAFLSDGRQPAAAAPQSMGETIRDAIVKSAGPLRDGVPDGYEFKDRVLWVDVYRDGRPAYTGVLSHWFKLDPPKADAGKSDSKLAAR
ncbi:MAG: hypothetical protein JWO31_1568 [Phycisphaerales bacterium]|nr:hypothetical protein [Phycisphaerales bacterium]